jgi:hypothetical protein
MCPVTSYSDTLLVHAHSLRTFVEAWWIAVREYLGKHQRSNVPGGGGSCTVFALVFCSVSCGYVNRRLLPCA